MANLLLGVTLILYGLQLNGPYISNIVFVVLFILTGLLLLFENRAVVVPNRV